MGKAKNAKAGSAAPRRRDVPQAGSKRSAVAAGPGSSADANASTEPGPGAGAGAEETHPGTGTDAGTAPQVDIRENLGDAPVTEATINETLPPEVPATAPSGGPSSAVNEDSVDADAARLEAQAGMVTEDPAMKAMQEQQVAQAGMVRMQTMGVFKGCLSPTFKMLAPNWAVEKGEIEMLSEAYTDCLLHYYPEGFAAVGPVLGALMATVAVFGPRMDVPLKVEAPKPAAGEGGEQKAAA
jgi:hypothetical protein